jgi:uncharacterized protein
VKVEKMIGLEREENRPKSVLKNLPVRVALLALRFYKTYLSFLFAGNCRFDPTCSQYAYQAIERFGVLRGVWLGLKRLLRCHPLSRKFGYDPVPESLIAHEGSHVAAGLQTHAFSPVHRSIFEERRGRDLCEPVRGNSGEVTS